ncbi:MAG: aldehyde dehydrogenase family protein [Thermoplasmata archaeon]
MTIVHRKYDDSVLADVSDTLIEELPLLEKSARSAVDTLSAMHEDDLSEIMFRASKIMDSEKNQIAGILSGESGKPIRFAENEVEQVAHMLQTLGEIISDPYYYVGEKRWPGTMTGIFSRNPLGVVFGITSFTDPLLNAAGITLPALSTGNPVLLKPSSKSPLSALKLRDILHRSGIPDNIMQVVIGNRDSPVIKSLLKSRYTDVVSFYGSVDSAHTLKQHLSAKTFVPHIGGGCVSIVWKDADLDIAGKRIAESSFQSQGQNAYRAQRIIVHPDSFEYLTGRLKEEVSQMITGDPADNNTDIAPLATPEYTQMFVSLIRMMFDHGDRLLEGGKIDGKLAQPTIIDVSTPESPAWKDDIMAPVISLISSDSIDSSIDLANRIGVRNIASVFTSSINTSFYYFKKLRFKEVVVNDSPDFRDRPDHRKKSSLHYRDKKIYDLLDEFSATKSMTIR